MNRRALRMLPLIAASTLVLASCTANATGQESASTQDRLQVVTSTTVYADLVARIGGDQVEVASLINSAAQDPHSYEATARDRLSLSKAQLVVANGGGYDAFIDALTRDIQDPETTLLTATVISPVSGDSAPEGEDADHVEDSSAPHGHAEHGHGSYNEHIWYDLESIRLLTDEIAHRLGSLKPEAAATFSDNAASLTTDLKKLESRVTGLRGALEGKRYAMTEPVPFHLLEDLGMKDATPEGLSESIEEGGEVSPQAFNDIGKLFDSRSIDMLAYNTQTESPQTERIRNHAQSAKVTVIDFTETLPDGTDYVSWMTANIQAVEDLVGK